MTPKDIAAIIDVARKRKVMSLSFTASDGCQVAFTLQPEESPAMDPQEQTDMDEQTAWGHSGFVPPNLEEHRLMAALLNTEGQPE